MGDDGGEPVVRHACDRALFDGLLVATSARLDWARLLRRTYEVDVLACPACHGRLRPLAAITDAAAPVAAWQAEGRSRAQRFADAYLRLDRDLVPGMVVAIEPGFYHVPAILRDPALVGPVEAELDCAGLARFADVRGIRLQDDVLVTDTGSGISTREIPIEALSVEATTRGRAPRRTSSRATTDVVAVPGSRPKSGALRVARAVLGAAR